MEVQNSKNIKVFTRREKVNLFLLKIATYIQLLIWLHFFEIMTYADSRMGMFQIILFFLILTAGAIKLVAVQLITGNPSEKKWLKGFMLLIFINIVLGFRIKYPSTINNISLFDVDLKAHINEGAPLPDDVELIYSDVPKDIYIFGRNGWDKKKHFTLSLSSFDSDFDFELIHPEFFEEYAKKLDYNFSDVYDCNSYGCQQLRFFDLFLPGYKFAVLTTTDPDVAPQDSYSVIGYSGNFYSPDSYYEEILNGEIDRRLKAYWDYIRNTFNSPYYRTKYKNDPYLLIWQGKYEEARARFDELPPERRAICEKYLAQRLAKEATLIRDKPVKSSMGAIEIKLVYPDVKKWNDRFFNSKDNLVAIYVGDTIQIEAEVKVNYDPAVQIVFYDVYRRYHTQVSDRDFDHSRTGRPLDTVQVKVINDKISFKWKVPESSKRGSGDLYEDDSVRNLKFYCRIIHKEVQRKSDELQLGGKLKLIALDPISMEPIPFLPYTYIESSKRTGKFDAQGSTTENLDSDYLEFDYEPAPVLRYQLIEREK